MIVARIREGGWKLGAVPASPQVSCVGDVVLTRDVMDGLMAGLLVSDSPPTGEVSFRGWPKANRDGLVAKYASELDRHYR